MTSLFYSYKYSCTTSKRLYQWILQDVSFGARNLKGTRTKPRQTKPRQTKSRHGQNLDMDKISTWTKSRHRQNLDRDKTSTDKISTRQNLDKTKSRQGHLLNKNLDNYFFKLLPFNRNTNKYTYVIPIIIVSI